MSFSALIQPGDSASGIERKDFIGSAVGDAGEKRFVRDCLSLSATKVGNISRDNQRRKMIILVSDGTNTRYNAHSYDDTLRLLLSSNISVYAIGVDSAVILRGTTLLSKYAHATGGDVYYAAGQSDLARLYAQATEQSRHQYTLGYLPQETDRAKVYHSIEVRIRRPGLTLLTRNGYYSVSGR